MIFRAIFGVLGNLTAFITFLLPAYSAIRTHAAIVSCSLWVLYGDGFLMTTNIVGFFMEYLILSLFFSPTFMDFMKNSGIAIVELICVYLIGFLALFTLDDPIKFIGTVCATGSISISVVEMVYETRRPLYLEIVAWGANAFIWTIYALVSSETIILVPNLVQLVQFAIRYRAHVKRPEP